MLEVIQIAKVVILIIVVFRESRCKLDWKVSKCLVEYTHQWVRRGMWQAAASAPACTPALLCSCVTEPAAKGSSILGLVNLMMEVCPEPSPVPSKFGCWGRQVMGMGHWQCRGESTEVLWGYRGLAKSALQWCFHLTAGFKPPSWHHSGKEVKRSLGFIFLCLKHSCRKQVLSGLPTLFLSVKCSFAKLIISVGWGSLKGTFQSSV